MNQIAKLTILGQYSRSLCCQADYALRQQDDPLLRI
jgi:hypothetical protein